MPNYEYQCKACQHYFLSMQSMTNRLIPIGEPCSECGQFKVEQVLTGAPALGDSVRLGIRRPDNGFKEVLQKIHEKTPGSVLKNNSSHI